MSTPLEKLRDFRTQVVNGHEPSDEEYKEILLNLRDHRKGVGKVSSKTAASKAPLDLNALFAPKKEKE